MKRFFLTIFLFTFFNLSWGQEQKCPDINFCILPTYSITVNSLDTKIAVHELVDGLCFHNIETGRVFHLSQENQLAKKFINFFKDFNCRISYCGPLALKDIKVSYSNKEKSFQVCSDGEPFDEIFFSMIREINSNFEPPPIYELKDLRIEQVESEQIIIEDIIIEENSLLFKIQNNSEDVIEIIHENQQIEIFSSLINESIINGKTKLYSSSNNEAFVIDDSFKPFLPNTSMVIHYSLNYQSIKYLDKKRVLILQLTTFQRDKKINPFVELKDPFGLMNDTIKYKSNPFSFEIHEVNTEQ